MDSKPSYKCRLCFTPGMFHINMFKTTQQIVQTIREIFHCELNEFDDLPNFICVDCWMTLKKFYEFYQNVLRAQSRYLGGFNATVKLETENHYEEISYADALNIEPQQNDMDAEMPEPSGPAAVGSTESDKFRNETKPFYGDANEISEFDDDLLEEAADHDSDPSFKSGSEHAASSDDDDDDDVDDDIDINQDDSDEFTPAKAYQRNRKLQPGQPKRGRGRPKKIREPVDDDDIDINEDDSDEFTPAKAYQRNRRLPGQPKRGRGRPKKIRDPADEIVDGSNWRNRKIHKCPHCIKKFTRRSHVTVHIRKRHGFCCSICNSRLPSELKLKQHLNIHEEGFEAKLREKLDEITAIDINDLSPSEKDAIWTQFDLKCDNCTVEFQNLNDAQVHYFNEHNMARGYLKCCDMKLREDVMVKEHMAYHKNPDIYYCFICEATIKVKSYLRVHLKSHIVEYLEQIKFGCDLCEKQFTSKAKLQYHVAETHAKENIKCEICSKKLFTHAQKDKHMRNVHEMMSQETLEYVMDHFDMSCDQCETMFESFPDAKRHYLREHSEPKGYIKCCGKKIRSLTTIEEHIQGHKNPNSLKCPICYKLFTIKENFQTHVRRHGQHATCEICGKTFKRHTTLAGHRRAVHESGERKYFCRFCSLRFLSDEKRNNHEQLIHYGNTTGARHVCYICGKGFHQANHLQKHIESHHSDDPRKQAKKEENKSEMCTICGLWLSSRYRLKLHRKCHSMEPNRCTECGLEAPNHDALLGHIRAFHEVRRKHKCRLCDESFSNANELQEHGLCHATEKLYQCAHCNETFVWRASLDAHLKKAHPNAWTSTASSEKPIELKPDPVSQETGEQ